ncbi:hypothetical protein ACFYPN_25960 [Streptomyces sp. NPDC005576]|uniref:hypothetical protein n=1 Tax=Streptomyces sp. NPDC005576 TaxID=3364726 RepID=UPI00368BA5CD
MLDASEEDAGGLAGRGELVVGCCFRQKLVRLVAACFGVGEECGEGREGWPAGVGEDAVRLGGEGCQNVADECAASGLAWPAGGELGEYECEGLVGRRPMPGSTTAVCTTEAVPPPGPP